jgi:hypothetical protein
MPEPLGLIVLLRNGPDYTLASRYIHNDETALNESITRVRKLMADNPDTFRADTEIAVGEVTIRDSK